MKVLSLALMLLSFNSLADVSIKKTFDGGEAKCLEMSEVGARAYDLTAINYVVNGESKEKAVTFRVNFYKCAEVPSGYGFRPSSADEILSSFILLPNGKMGMTKNTLVKATFFANDENGKVLAVSNLVKSGDNSKVTFTFKNTERKVFISAALESNISSEIGLVEGSIQYYGGFVIRL